MTVALWGSAFVGIRDAGAVVSPGALTLGRLLVSVCALGLVVWWRREPWPERSDVGRIVAFGLLFLGVYSVALNAAEQRVDAGTAAMLINVGPILIAIGAGVFLREGFPPRLFAGCGVAFLGTVLIGLSSSQGGGGAGIALLVLAVLAYASAVVIQKSVLGRATPLAVTWVGCLAATLACLPFLPALVGDLGAAGTSGLLWIVYLGVGPTALGFATWAYALRHMSAGRLASLAYLIPVVAVVLGWALLGETPAWVAALGGALCVAGVAVARR